MGKPNTFTGTARASKDFAPVPFILSRKTLPKNNVIVGDDPACIRFMSQRLNTTVQRVEKVTDDVLMGREGLLLHVFAAHRIDVSPEVKSRTGFWAADPVVRGSASIAAIVKYAATLLNIPEKKFTKEMIEIASNKLTREPVQDIRGLITKAVYLLTGDLKRAQHWVEPWENSRTWLTPDMIPEQRLHTLYKRLVAYVFAKYINYEDAKKTGLRPSDIQRLHQLSLDPDKVYETLRILSRWKNYGCKQTYIFAIQIAAVWD